MKISYSCLIVAVVIGLGTVTADPAGKIRISVIRKSVIERFLLHIYF